MKVILQFALITNYLIKFLVQQQQRMNLESPFWEGEVVIMKEFRHTAKLNNKAQGNIYRVLLAISLKKNRKRKEFALTKRRVYFSFISRLALTSINYCSAYSLGITIFNLIWCNVLTSSRLNKILKLYRTVKFSLE